MLDSFGRARHAGLERPDHGQARQAQANAAILREQLATLRRPTAPAYPANNTIKTRLQSLARMLGRRPADPLRDDERGGRLRHALRARPARSPRTCKRRPSTRSLAFQADLEARGLADRVLVHLWSEFGRRPEENGSAGTDHGAAGVGFLIGPRVKRA